MDAVDERIFDRSRYSSQMIRDLDIMSVYFVDVIYNYLYDEAKKLKIEGKTHSVTEGYKHALDAFISALGKNPKLYRKALSGIHEKFLEYSAQAMTFPQCMTRITKHFIPEDYYSSLADGEKMSILNLVINQAIKELVMKIVKSYIVKIIDYHSEGSNVSLLKEELIDLFIYERMGVYTRFMSKKTVTNKTAGVSAALLERMQGEIKRLITEKIDLEKKNKQTVEILLKRIEQVKDLHSKLVTSKSEFAELKSQYAALNSEFDLLKTVPAPAPTVQPSTYTPDYVDRPPAEHEFAEPPPLVRQTARRAPRKLKRPPVEPVQPDPVEQPEPDPVESALGQPALGQPALGQPALGQPEPEQVESPPTASIATPKEDGASSPGITVPKKASPPMDLGNEITLDAFI